MNYENINTILQEFPAINYEVQIKDSPVVNNRLEALKVLSQLLMQEVEALKNNNKSRDAVIEEIVDGKIDLEKEVQKYEMELIRCALVNTGGRQRKAARLLNVKTTTLNAKIKRYGIDINLWFNKSNY